MNNTGDLFIVVKVYIEPDTHFGWVDPYCFFLQIIKLKKVVESIDTKY